MKFEYDVIYKRVRYMQEEYSFKHSKTYFSLLELLNVIGQDGWELIGLIEGELMVKREVNERWEVMGDNMSWNYRVIKEEVKYGKSKNTYDIFRIIEVYYDKNGEIHGYSDSSDGILIWNEYEDLKGTVEYVGQAFSRPVLTLKNGELIE